MDQILRMHVVRRGVDEILGRHVVFPLGLDHLGGDEDAGQGGAVEVFVLHPDESGQQPIEEGNG